MRMLSMAAVAVFGSLAALSVSDAPVAQAQEKSERSCFFARDVAGWREARLGVLNLRTTRGDYYQATLFASCPNIDFNYQLAIVTRVSERVCEGDDATLIVPRGLGAGPDRCRIDRIRKLTDEEVAALKPGEKP